MRRRPLLLLLVVVLVNLFSLSDACISGQQSSPAVVADNCPYGRCFSVDNTVQLSDQSQQQSVQIGGIGANLQNYLGGDVSARAYSSGSTGRFIAQDVDLQCDGLMACQWRNVFDDDDLDWAIGTGVADGQRLQLVTGRDDMPDSDFLVLASDARDANEHGLLVSDPIGCQLADAQLSFRHWRSRAHTDEQQPDLEVCRRFTIDSMLRDCQLISAQSPTLVTIAIPPSDQSFELVFRGFGFENYPEGGLIFLDDITYHGNVLAQDGCPTELFTEPTIRGTLSTNAVSFSWNNAVSTDAMSCKLLKCSFNRLDQICNYNRKGSGANGYGLSNGWTVMTAADNTANPLTGVRMGARSDQDDSFAIADFADPRQSVVEATTRYVLESKQIDFHDGHEPFIGFDRYLPVNGVRLQLCTDAAASECFWTSQPLSRGASANRNRMWIREYTRLPVGINKLFIITQYDRNQRWNAGQVGLSNIRLYTDANGTNEYC